MVLLTIFGPHRDVMIRVAEAQKPQANVTHLAGCLIVYKVEFLIAGSYQHQPKPINELNSGREYTGVEFHLANQTAKFIVVENHSAVVTPCDYHVVVDAKSQDMDFPLFVQTAYGPKDIAAIPFFR